MAQGEANRMSCTQDRLSQQNRKQPESTTHKPDIDITQDKIQRGKY